MVDTLGIAASALGIVTAAAHTIHELVGLIDRIEGAPPTVHQLRNELSDVESVVCSFQGTLEKNSKNSSWRQLLDESKLSNAMKTLRNVCESFACSLEKWTTHSSTGDKLSFRDEINMAMYGKKISHLSVQLSNCKQTVILAPGCCDVQSRIHKDRTTKNFAELMTREKEATKLHTKQTAVLEGLRSDERQLQLVRAQAEDAGDIDNIERVEEDLRDVSRTRTAISQFATVSEYIAKSSTATLTNQDIGKIIIADLGYGAVGISNMDNITDIKQKIGDVSVGSGGTGFIGIHGKVDHNAALAGRWTSGKRC